MRRQGLVLAGAAGGEAGLGHLLGRGRGLPWASGARFPPRTLPVARSGLRAGSGRAGGGLPSPAVPLLSCRCPSARRRLRLPLPQVGPRRGCRGGGGPRQSRPRRSVTGA